MNAGKLPAAPWSITQAGVRFRGVSRLDIEGIGKSIGRSSAEPKSDAICDGDEFLVHSWIGRPAARKLDETQRRRRVSSVVRENPERGAGPSCCLAVKCGVTVPTGEATSEGS